MGMFRLLVVPLLMPAWVAPLMAQTNQLPEGCRWVEEFQRPMHPLKNPFPRPVLFPQVSLLQEGSSLPEIASPQCLVYGLPMVGENGVNRRCAKEMPWPPLRSVKRIGAVCH
jgi:hypothetical protein